MQLIVEIQHIGAYSPQYVAAIAQLLSLCQMSLAKIDLTVYQQDLTKATSKELNTVWWQMVGVMKMCLASF